MDFCYLIFRSVTQAQRGERVLKREGYHCSLMRASRWMGQRSCAYALRVRLDDQENAIRLLRQSQIPFERGICPPMDDKKGG